MPAQSSMDFLTQTLASAKKEQTLSGIPLVLVKNGVPAHSSYGFLAALPLAKGKEEMGVLPSNGFVVQQALALGKRAVQQSSMDFLT